MPRRKEIPLSKGPELFSVQEFDKDFDLSAFNGQTLFRKWAAMEVSETSTAIPEGVEELLIPEGLYVVFQYKGAMSEAARVFTYLFYQWLPSSEFILDHRPHFEILGEKFNHSSANSEEEIWIPVERI